jgi:BASS family bile acid:Na+ symporter
VTLVAAGLILFALMLAVGLELTPDDFRRVARYPRAVWVGTLANMCVLPLVTVILLRALDASPNLEAGLVLITATPGAAMSNVFTYLAGAHTALSVTLTAIASLLAVVTLPIIMAFGMRGLSDAVPVVQVPVLALGAQLLFLVVLPTLLGMALRKRWPEATRRHAGKLRGAALCAVVAVIAVSAGADDHGLADEVIGGLPLAFAWTSMALLLGVALASAARLDADDRITIGIELAAKNVGISAIVALTALESAELAVFAGAYVAVGYPFVLATALVRRRLRGARSATAIPISEE